MPSLFVIQGRNRGQRFQLDEPQLSIGRVAENGVQLHDTEVSRKHAELTLSGKSYFIRDLNSSNGTYVNGKPVRQHELASGDQLQMGRTLLLYTGQNAEMGDPDSHVAIVAPRSDAEGSRILHAMSQSEGSELLSTPINQTQSPWLARARSNLQLMYRTAIAASHTLDLDELLSRIMDMIFEWVDADRGCIMLKNPETGELEPRVRRQRRGLAERRGAGEAVRETVVADGDSSHGESIFDNAPSDEAAKEPPAGQRERITISKTILDYVVEKREGVLTSDAGDDSRWDSAKSIISFGVREAICVPMQGRHDVVGVIYIDTSISPQQMLKQKSANKFGQDHLKLMIAIAHQAAMAVENTYYYQAMVQAERLAAVGQTIATLSHHIKNILQGVRGGSYLIEMGMKDQAEALEHLSRLEALAGDSGQEEVASARKAVETMQKGWGIVDKNQERISKLVLDMLTFSKEREPEPEPANLNEVAADAVELMQTHAKEAEVELHWAPAEAMPTLLFDPEALHRAILNLVSNAIDACEDRGVKRVDVATQVDESLKLATLTVRDTGVGIDKSQVEAIFTPFTSGKGARGTGLGLPVSQKIATEHGGKIRVTSEPGAGSTFTLELPMQSPNGEADPDDGAEPHRDDAPHQDDSAPVTP
ncbi:Sensor protein ZraS [Pseudobythopirellula maris]|uniref:histidine kinase n=1 Tax=Pseudobythopirellula maris TaxID=2527991 RepID=A0A5C5ZWJ0_9BACT|nr:ATP-binding protein [Pseudobythopirellula maris]TWT90633.1 Sensor protein ZraS [Pseudobythopirellula maris]